MHPFNSRISEAAIKRCSKKCVFFKPFTNISLKELSFSQNTVRLCSSNDELFLMYFQGFCKSFKSFLMVRQKLEKF